jgi:hypothetical protein
MPARTRPYLFYDTAVSLCSTCYRRIDAKIVFEDDNVFMLKRCPRHGFERVLIADDVDYYRRCRVTHPKNISDLIISDAELSDVMIGFVRLMASLLKLGADLGARILREHSES